MARLHSVTASLPVRFTAACICLMLLPLGTPQAQAADTFLDAPGRSAHRSAALEAQTPVLMAPSNGAAVSTTTPQLVWQPVAGVTSYLVHISRSNAMALADAVLWTWVSGTSYDVPAGLLAPDSTYYWSVLLPPDSKHYLSVQQAGGYAWPMIWSFNTGSSPQAPAVPTQPTPADESLTCSLPTSSIAFSWQSAGDQFHIQISSHPSDFEPPYRLANETLSTNTYLLSADGLDAETFYYWHVRSRPSAGAWSAWSKTWRFSPTCLITPADGATENPPVMLSWMPALTDGDGLTLMIWDDADALVLNDNVTDLTDYPVSIPPLVDGQSYAWALSYRAAPSGFEVLTSVRSFTVTLAPKLVYPAHSAANVSLQPTLLWEAVPGMSHYKVQLADDPDFTNKLVNETIDSTSWQVDTGLLVEERTYSWRVKAGPSSTGPWSDWAVTDFSTPEASAPPPAPTEGMPNSGGVSLTPTFSWSNTAPTYLLEISTDPNFDKEFRLVYEELTDHTVTYQDLIESAVLPSVLDGEATYYWRVKARNSAGETWSPVWSFTTIERTVPSLGWPRNAATVAYSNLAQGVVNFTFKTIDQAPVNYKLYVYANAGCTSGSVASATINGPAGEAYHTEPIAGLDGDTVHSWQVQLLNTATWSVCWQFTTEPFETPPSSVSLIAPDDGRLDVHHESIHLQWQPALYATRYHVQLARDESFVDIVDQDASVRPTGGSRVAYWVDPEKTDPGTLYSWRVEAFNSQGGSGFTLPWSFTTRYEAPAQLLAPVAGSLNLEQPVRLVWTGVEGAQWYEIELSPEDEFPSSNRLRLIAGTTEKTVTGLLGGTTYYWHVRTRVGQSKSYWSHTGHFTTALLPLDPPQLDRPPFNATQVPLLPLFDWHHEDPDVDTYTWQLHTTDAFDDPAHPPLMQQTGLSQSQYHLTVPLSEQTSYFWRVIAHDTDAPGGPRSMASTPSHFTTVGPAALAAPSLEEPRPNQTGVALRPVFRWSHPQPETVASYTLEIDLPGGGFDPPFRQRPGLLLEPYRLDEALEAGRAYDWRVVAFGGGDEAASAVERFTTATGPVLVVEPWPVLDLGETLVGDTSARALVIRHGGERGVLAGQYGLPSGTAFHFAGETTGDTFSLGAGQEKEVWVWFAPSSAGPYSAPVEFTVGGDRDTLFVAGEGIGGAPPPVELGRYYYLKDHLGSVRATVDESGAVVHYDDYYPFGAQMPGRSSMSEYASKERYTGHEYDDETETDGMTGLYYAGARYYDPVLGKWPVIDPLSDDYPSHSPYSYAANNPLIFIDPEGLEWFYYQADDEDEKRWHYHEDTPEMVVWNGQYDDDGNKVMELQGGMMELLSYDGETLSWHQADGTSLSLRAYSGILDENGNIQADKQWEENVGPIPEGWFIVDPENVQNWDNLSVLQKATAAVRRGQWPGGTIAWGEHRVPIEPYQYRNRGDFFIHGGSFPGSAGCIDLCENNKAFFRVFSVHHKPVGLHVSYNQ